MRQKCNMLWMAFLHMFCISERTYKAEGAIVGLGNGFWLTQCGDITTCVGCSSEAVRWARNHYHIIFPPETPANYWPQDCLQAVPTGLQR